MSESRTGEFVNGKRVRLDLAEGAVAAWRFGAAGAPPMLFCHANGFCASTYRATFQLVGAHFDVLAIDLRGHGRSTLPIPSDRHRSWMVYATDIAAVVDAAEASLGMKGAWTLAGHSMGATSALLAAPILGMHRIAKLKLIDPVFTPAPVRLLVDLKLFHRAARRWRIVRSALGRRRAFPDRPSAKAQYEGRKPFAAWAPGVLDDYLEDGLVDTQDGVRLACAPEWEAANYMAQGNPIWRATRAAGGAVHVLAAETGSTVFGRALHGLMKCGAEVEIAAGCGHLIPMENPRLAADFLIRGNA